MNLCIGCEERLGCYENYKEYEEQLEQHGINADTFECVHVEAAKIQQQQVREAAESWKAVDAVQS